MGAPLSQDEVDLPVSLDAIALVRSKAQDVLLDLCDFFADQIDGDDPVIAVVDAYRSRGAIEVRFESERLVRVEVRGVG